MSTDKQQESTDKQQNTTAGDLQKLIERAADARNCALARYSNFCVGAALEAEGGELYTGCNVESAAYEQTICAERVAIWKALSEGERKFSRLAVVVDTERLTPPCGACRQVIWEFCGDIPVILANTRGDTETLQMRDLLPRPFDSNFLEETEAEKK
ncbi:MAG: cytidine deaminase [Acidobacteria bacterium]|nr:MAG: cytidine deaminase [Acidobacteriota bacterium]